MKTVDGKKVITKGEIRRGKAGGVFLLAIGMLSTMTFGWMGLLIGLPMAVIGARILAKAIAKGRLYKRLLAEGKVVDT